MLELMHKQHCFQGEQHFHSYPSVTIVSQLQAHGKTEKEIFQVCSVLQ